MDVIPKQFRMESDSEAIPNGCYSDVISRGNETIPKSTMLINTSEWVAIPNGERFRMKHYPESYSHVISNHIESNVIPTAVRKGNYPETFSIRGIRYTLQASCISAALRVRLVS